MSGEPIYALPDTLTGEEIRYFRQQFHMTRRQLAEFANVSVRTVEHWENSDQEITGPIVTLVRVIREQPTMPEYFEVPPRRLPIRMWYMHKNEPCTLIEVDETIQLVRIRNYTRRIQYRAFGVIEEPTYEDYQAFLESRCFPRTRDKMKIELEHLHLPFYDPIMIIGKTKGRMAEDDFWIDLEH